MKVAFADLIKPVALLFAAVLALSACETMEGMGQDVENAGEAIQDGAN